MKALLIAKNGDELYYTNIAEHHRGGFVILADKQPLSAKVDVWLGPISLHTRTFKWTGTVINSKSAFLFELFEEIET